ncbi:MAG: FtsW/RodA/SpoVE family cell cycle protein, partial [Hyphomicrobiales bacterium]
AFVILSAWLFSEGQKRSDVPVLPIAFGIYGLFVLLLVLQPDFGQALLVTLVWGGLFFLTGIPMVWVGVMAAAAGVAGTLAYFLVPHVRARFDKFFFADGDTFQTDRALQSFEHGGWFGRGPGEGTVKDILPDSHSDFIFAVAAEEYGLIMCMVILALFAFVVLRGLYLALTDPEPGIRFPVTGLMMLFGFQAVINMAVNVGLLPAKGMTLPFISYGGSSMLSMGILMGFVIGLTRRRPQAARIHAYGGGLRARKRSDAEEAGA